MTGQFFLDWSALAVSLFNASLLIWLGLTVALNAERPRRARAAGQPGAGWGTALIAASLLLGGLFFVAHSALLTYDLNSVSLGLNFWWHLGWWPVIALPLAWYVLVLWYSGYWDDPHTALHRRHRFGLWLSTAGLLLMVGLVLFANPLPSLGPGARPNPNALLEIASLPLLALAYPLYILLCMSLALDALLRPGPTGRLLGDLARRRARPWLAAGSALLVLVSLLVGWAIVWVFQRFDANPALPVFITPDLARAVGWVDLTIASLIAVAVVLLGQSLVAYEVFTGKSLPRRGLLRFWGNAVVLAAGYGLVAGWSLTLHLRPTYIVLLSIGLLSVFYALFSWRSYVERERYMQQLRPFVASQRLYDHLLEQAQPSAGAAVPELAPDAAAAQTTFRALCRNVLDARLAYLVAVGPSARLTGPPLVYQAAADAQLAPPGAGVEAVAAISAASEQAFLAVELPEAPGVHWAVALRNERQPAASAGLIGLLLLGDKLGGGLYTQEEIDIARAGGERLIDTLASAELARRLVVLQRQRLAESQVLDQRTRRVIHDDVLPQLHAALLHLHALPAPAGAAEVRVPATGVPDRAAPVAEAISLLAGAHRQLAELLRELPSGPEPEVARLGLFAALHRLATGEFAHAFDAVSWQVDPLAEEQAGRLPPLAAEVLFYAAREAMRNAARHGRRDGAPAALSLIIRAAWNDKPGPARGLSITVEDNGAGVLDNPGEAQDGERLGAGQGLALHSTLLAVVGGSLTIESEPGIFTRVTLCLPILAT
jgi:signal transduction histidine kinase